MKHVYLLSAGCFILVLPTRVAYKSIHGCWIAPHTARCCHIIIVDDLEFIDKAKLSLMCYHIRRPFLIEPTSRNNDTYASTSVVTVLAFRRQFGPATGFLVASLINLFLHPQTEGNRRSPLKVSPVSYHMGDGGGTAECY